jgi:hypothetical protein
VSDFIDFAANYILFGLSNRGRRDGKSMAAYIEGREAQEEFTGKPEENRPFGTHWNRWEDNIKMHFKEIQGEA